MRHGIRKLDFSGGLNKRDDEYSVAENEVVDVVNYLFRERGKAVTRRGFRQVYGPFSDSVLTLTSCDSLNETLVFSSSRYRVDGSVKVQGTGSIAADRKAGGTMDNFSSPHPGLTNNNTKTITINGYIDSFSSSSGYTFGNGATISDGRLTFPQYNGWAQKNYNPAISLADLGGDALFEVYILNHPQNPSKRKFEIRFYSGSSYFYKYFETTTINLWHTISFTKSSFSTSGNPSWANITAFYIRIVEGNLSTIDYVRYREKSRSFSFSFGGLQPSTYALLGPKDRIDSGTLTMVVAQSGYTSETKTTISLTLSGNSLSVTQNSSPYGHYGMTFSDYDGSMTNALRTSTSYSCTVTLATRDGDYFPWPERTITLTFHSLAMTTSGITITYDSTVSGTLNIGPHVSNNRSLYLHIADSNYGFHIVASTCRFADSQQRAWVLEDKTTFLGSGAFSSVRLEMGKGTHEGGTTNFADIRFVDIVLRYASTTPFVFDQTIYLDHVFIDTQVFEPITGLASYVTRDGVKYLYAMKGGKIYNAVTKQKLYNGSSTRKWTSANIVGILILNNPDVGMLRTTDGQTFTLITDTNPWPQSSNVPPRCEYITQFKNRLFCWGLTDADKRNLLVFSELGDPSVAGAWPANNWIRIGASVGDYPSGMAVFSDSLIVFKSQSVWVLMGDDPFNFTLQQIEDAPGCIAPFSVVSTPIGVFYLSPEGVMLFDGRRAVNISSKVWPAMREWVHSSSLLDFVGAWHDERYILWGKFDNSFAYSVEEDATIHTGNEHAYVYDLRPEPHWTYWETPPVTYTLRDGTSLLAGAFHAPIVMTVLDGLTDLERPIYGKLVTKSYNAGNPETIKYWHDVRVSVQNLPEFSISYMWAETETGEEAEIPIAIFEQAYSYRVVRTPIGLRGRRVRFGLHTFHGGEPLSILGVTVMYKERRLR